MNIGTRGAKLTALLFALALVAAVAPALSAQQTDVIRGRVTADDGKVVANARISATSIPNNVTKGVNTDKNGRYTITFQNGDGDYWISVMAIGYGPRRFELKRVADEDVLIGDMKLAASVTVLDSVQVRAGRARAGRNDNAGDISGTEKSVGVSAVDPSQAGNIAAMAASLPGVQLIPGSDGNPDQFSVFGLSGDQNKNTLNGLGFGGGDIPRDAATKSSLGTSPWDVSRGGFSGGQFAMRTQSGSNFSSRGMSSLINAPALEWTDRAGRSLGAAYTSFSVGASTAGPIALDKSFYSAGYQFDRRRSDAQSLTSADAFALRTAGVSPDSVARLRNILGGLGVPLSAATAPDSRTSDRGLFLGTIDIAPPASTSGQALNVTGAGSVTRFTSPFGQVTALPTADAESVNLFGSLQARHTSYFGFGVLTESSIGITGSRASFDPYLALPSGAVRVNSALDDDASAISQLAFGGSTIQNAANSSGSAAAQNQLSWFSNDSKHRIKFSSEVRYDRFAQDLTMNRLGAFSYNSLADLAAGTPASFTRLLAPRVVSGSGVAGGVSLGDSYRPTPDVQIQFGVRLDANRFLTVPGGNADVATTFAVENAHLPNRVYASPRAGFAWSYGEAPQLAVATGFTRGPRAVLRGGFGVFQNTLGVQQPASALANTGLSNAEQQLMCVGSAVPVPNWTSYRDLSTIPVACADGTAGTVFASAVPNVVLFDRAFSAPRSARANLNWTGLLPGNRFAATIDATYSSNLAQPGMRDLNFSDVVRFGLADEGGRPVYVRPSSIVTSTGSIASADARVSPAFGRVLEQQSDLRSESRQLGVAIRPVAFSTAYSWSVAYVYSNTRDIAAGLSSTAGDPLARAWARSSLDSRHQVTFSVAYNVRNWIPLSLSGTLRSGRPFTPLVSGDINGDGVANDRAFVFNPRAATDAALSAGIQSLLDGGSRAARRCLSSQMGLIAVRNSCEAPWTATSSLTIGLNPVKFRLPQRLNISLYVNNVLGAADLLLHGENNRRGWGQTAFPDQTLYFVRGFDAAAQRFRYEVNPRFGATRLDQTLNRNPVVVTLQARVDVGYTRERQLLTQSLDRGRVRPGNKQTDQELAGMSGALIPANPMTLILQQEDSLRLTRRQADSLSTLNRRFSLAFSSIWTPVAKYLAALPDGYDRRDAYERYRKAREASVDALIRIAPAIRGLLTAAQIRALPAKASSSLDTRYLASVRSSTAGGTDLGVLGMLAQMGWMGGTVDASGGAQTIMVHK